MNPDPKALLRTEMIVRVRAGLMTATAAAEKLGVSRKTYYKWEKKGLQAMLAAAQNDTAGRRNYGSCSGSWSGGTLKKSRRNPTNRRHD
jgi:DNA-binding XRE family transcriptional regulator